MGPVCIHAGSSVATHGHISLMLVPCPAGGKGSLLSPMLVRPLLQLSKVGDHHSVIPNWRPSCVQLLIVLYKQTKVLYPRLLVAYCPCDIMGDPSERLPAFTRLLYEILRVIAGLLMCQAAAKSLYPRLPYGF